MAIVEFSADEFRSQYPGFSDENKYPDEFLGGCFESAEVFVPNGDSSYIPYDPENHVYERQKLLYLATCHIASVMGDPSASSGRISSSSQGSVSISFDLPQVNSITGAWWTQSQCGWLYWTLTAKYRLGGRICRGNNFHPWG